MAAWAPGASAQGGTATAPADDRQRALEALGAPAGGPSAGEIGRGTVRLFGLEGSGSKYAFVIDRSGSMGGGGGKALKAAKAELAAAIEPIERTQQFQIVFYNERPLHFNPAQYGRLAFGTDTNKERARRFIETIVPDGGTDHELALGAALGLRPDVVFLLTDADKPQLTALQLEKVRRWAAGTVIHAIEFGQGPDRGEWNFLRQLAAENGGQHTYVDVSRLTH